MLNILKFFDSGSNIVDVIASGFQVGHYGWNKLQENDRILKISQQFNLVDIKDTDDPDTVYAYALVEYARSKPEPTKAKPIY